MRVYHTETQEDFNALMEELEREGCIWGNDNLLTELKHKWTIWRKDTVIIVKKGALAILPKSCVTNDKLIVKFTKSNNIKSKVPVVPQFIAEWINHCKQKGYDLFLSIDYDDSDMPYEIYEWLTSTVNNQELFALAWLDSYEVEKEPLYYVKFVDANNGNKCYLNVRSDGCKTLNNSVQNDIFKTQFTEAEIKEMDERYWQFAVPVEEVSK
ncbi:DUF1642 domain-containing protein [Listeria monocytogenes]